MSVSLASPTIPTNRAILNLAWPLTLKAMMLHGIVVIDAWLVSALGEPALAAMGLAASFGALLLGVLAAFANATQIRVAQAFGTGDPVNLKTAFVAGMIISLVVALIGLVIVWALAGTFIDHFAHTPWIAGEARSYLSVFLWVVTLEAVGQCMGSYFNGCGKTKAPFLSYLVAIPINVGISYALIHGHFGLPEMGVTGAAVGSAVGALARVLFLAVGFLGMTGGFRNVAGWRNTTLQASIRRHLAFSLPIAGTFVSNTVANYVSTLLFVKMTVNDFAAMTLIQPWVMVAGTFSISWAMATGIAVAQLLGRDCRGPELDTFLRRAWRGALIAAGIVALAFFGIILASGTLYGNLEAGTRAALLSFLPFLLILPFPKGSNAMCGHTLRAGGDTLYVMNIFLAAQWLFRVPLTALFILYLDLSVTWVFALFLAEELVKFPSFHLRLLKGEWKRGLADD
ncbi:MATE family efflux transporter [Tropicimonas sediminicola]|uniref:Na+-driven multidrug efflux pump n=1 Tax=Tropicimonas sediminicola TaxID=1031541 RepID=A0A239D5D6_9RHOB|nr:MATE family efflux transporter [Tropicimonas sediminicola]SNS27362.1 Na+-driven multidrug efflux pump [Tropicimonas sediminicola]